jgi:hypothetical protein
VYFKFKLLLQITNNLEKGRENFLRLFNQFEYFYCLNSFAKYIYICTELSKQINTFTFNHKSLFHFSISTETFLFIKKYRFCPSTAHSDICWPENIFRFFVYALTLAKSERERERENVKNMFTTTIYVWKLEIWKKFPSFFFSHLFSRNSNLCSYAKKAGQ